MICCIYSGQKLLHGHGVDVNEADAMQWFRDWVLHLFIQLINFSLFRMASKNGHPHSSYNLAIGYLNGIETDIDEGEEEDLLRHAVRHGVEGSEAVLDHICRIGACLGDEDYYLDT